MTLTISPPCWSSQEASLPALLHAIGDFRADYWDQGSGGAALERVDETGLRLMLTITPDLEEKTFYLAIHRFEGRRVVETWLSLGDGDRLGEVFAAGDELTLSRGLFLAPALALHGTREFAETGRRTEEIEWIRPEDLPPNANY